MARHTTRSDRCLTIPFLVLAFFEHYYFFSDDDSKARNMLFALAVYFVHRNYPLVFKTYLCGFNTLWGQLLSITTFTLTFFVNQSYALWRKCMELSRRLQGRSQKSCRFLLLEPLKITPKLRASIICRNFGTDWLFLSLSVISILLQPHQSLTISHYTNNERSPPRC